MNAADLPAASRGRLEALALAIRSEAAAAQADRDLLAALVDIRTAEVEVPDPAVIDAAYAGAFRKVDLDFDALPVDEAAARLRRRPGAVVVELAAFLDHWSGIRRSLGRPAESWLRLLDVARAADPDPYRDRFRELLKGKDLSSERPALRALAADRRSADLPAPTVVLLADALARAGEAEGGVVLLERAALRQPGDAWINYMLAEWLEQLIPPQHEEALRYYAAARAMRPEMVHNLAHVLIRMRRDAEAERVLADLVARRPDDPYHRTCYAVVLVRRGRPDVAVATLGEAIRRSPGHAGCRAILSLAPQAVGRHADAIEAWRESLRIDPAQPEVWFWLGRRLARVHRMEQFEEVARRYPEQIRLEPHRLRSYLVYGPNLIPPGRPWM